MRRMRNVGGGGEEGKGLREKEEKIDNNSSGSRNRKYQKSRGEAREDR